MGISITGLVSGLDTTQIISDLMDVERIPYTNLETKKSQLQTEQSVFRSVNTQLKTLSNALFELKSYNLNSSYKATSSSNAISVSTTGSAVAGSYSIQVTNAAVNATAATMSSDLVNAIKNGDFKIGQLDFSKPSEGSSNASSSLWNKLDLSKATDDQILSRVTNYINANSELAGSSVSMVRAQNSEEYYVQFTSLSSNDVKISGNYLTSSLLGANKTLNTELQSGQKQLITTDGKKAEFSVNGISYSSESNTINNIIDGVTFTLSDYATTSTITVATDTDAIVSKIKTFVTAYNDLISSVKSNLEKPESDDIINPLQGDSVLKDINSQLYNIFNKFTSAGFMEDIGLSIDKGVKTGSAMTRQITFDEAAFTNALKNNSAKVEAILSEVSTAMDQTITKSYTSVISGVLTKKIAGYDSEIKQVDSRLEAMDRSLAMKEARLKSQFSSMEVMMSSLQTTQNWLTSQFESLTKSKD